MTQTAGPEALGIRKDSLWLNPWFMMLTVFGVGFLVVGGLIAWQAHHELSQVTWDGNDVEALRDRESGGQRFAILGGVLTLGAVVLAGVRYEADRVIAAFRNHEMTRPVSDNDSID